MVVPFLGFPRISVWEPGDPTHRVHPGWPENTQAVTLRCGNTVRLRPLMKRDGESWRQLRLKNQQALQPVEPTVSTTWEDAHSRESWNRTFNYLRYSAGEGSLVPMVIEVDGKFVGQLTVGNILRGVSLEGWIGYWVDGEVTGRGVAKAAVALGTDLAFQRIGLHRLTATYLPANPASGAVLAANGFVEEGLLRRNLHIDGQWQDHILMAQVVDDFERSCVERLRHKSVIN